MANSVQTTPPGINFVADNQVIEQVMTETLDQEVKVASVIVRNKEKDSTKRAFLKGTARPAVDTIEVGGKTVVLRVQAEEEKEADQQKEGFFAGLKKRGSTSRSERKRTHTEYEGLCFQSTLLSINNSQSGTVSKMMMIMSLDHIT